MNPFIQKTHLLCDVFIAYYEISGLKNEQDSFSTSILIDAAPLLIAGIHLLYRTYYIIITSSFVRQLSYFQAGRCQPGPGVLVQVGQAPLPIRWPVHCAVVHDVLHRLVWRTTFAFRDGFYAPPLHGLTEPSYTRSDTVICCPLSARQVLTWDVVGCVNERVQPGVFCSSPLFFPSGTEPRPAGDIFRC